MLEIRNLHVRFHNRDREAVSGLSLTIGDGEILGLVGESGSGKTVTAMSIFWTGRICCTQTAAFCENSTAGRSAWCSRSQ